MTVIAAMWDTDGSILIGADSLAVDGSSGIYHTVEKLKAHPSGYLAWGTAGSLSIGIRFTEWLASENMAHDSWNDIEKKIKEKVCELNGDEKELVENARSTPDSNDGIWVLLAGYLNGEAGLFSVNDRANCQIIDQSWKFESVGAGLQAKFIMLGIDCALAHLATVGESSPLDRLQRMRLLFDTITTQVHGCGPPIHIWRVGENGIDRLVGPGAFPPQ